MRRPPAGFKDQTNWALSDFICRDVTRMKCWVWPGLVSSTTKSRCLFQCCCYHHIIHPNPMNHNWRHSCQNYWIKVLCFQVKSPSQTININVATDLTTYVSILPVTEARPGGQTVYMMEAGSSVISHLWEDSHCLAALITRSGGWCCAYLSGKMLPEAGDGGGRWGLPTQPTSALSPRRS